MTEQTAWSVPGYVAHELIGFGGSGEVWLGRALPTGETVALKRLRSGAGDGARGRLRREAALLAALDHPHLLQVRELVTTEQDTVLVLDHAAGGSLAMLLRQRGRLRAGEVVSVLAPVAAALAYAHGEGLVHGDVTPANVLFTAEGRPLLADLGVARVVGEQIDPHSTPEYVDPAVAAGAAAGPASDVFMLAAVALHALTGAPPWQAPTPEEAFAQAAECRAPDVRALAPDLPEGLAAVLQRALSTHPAQRGSAAELALDVRHACPPEPLVVGSTAGLAGWPGPGASPAGGPSASALTHAVRSHRRLPAAVGEEREPSQHGSLDTGPRHRQVPGGQRGAVRSSQRRRRPTWAAWVAAGIVLALLGGLAWGSRTLPEQPTELAVVAPGPPAGGPPETQPSGQPAAARGGPPRSGSASARWAGVLDALDARRARAYERGEVALLRQVYLPGRHLSSDISQLQTLLSAGYTAGGVRHRFGAVEVERVWPGRVRLRVAQSLPVSLRLRDGVAAGQIPGTEQTVILLDLVATGEGWRLA